MAEKMTNIILQSTALPGVLILESKKFTDERGYFAEVFKKSEFEALGLNVNFVQDSFSYSKKGVLRGLHYQLPPKAQGKLVRVVEGRVWDVAVDIRKSSPTFKQWVAEELSEENGKSLYIPEGFAHGFVVLSDSAKFYYKMTNEYSPQHERGIIWNDSELNIAWPEESPVLSQKDRKYPKLGEAEVFA